MESPRRRGRDWLGTHKNNVHRHAAVREVVQACRLCSLLASSITSTPREIHGEPIRSAANRMVCARIIVHTNPIAQVFASYSIDDKHVLINPIMVGRNVLDASPTPSMQHHQAESANDI